MSVDMSLFEMAMLFCFGASWPFAVYKTYKTRNVTGKSVLFITLILLGYIFGIFHKLLYNLDAVIFLYVFNGILVFAELIMYFRYRKLVHGGIAGK